MNFGECIEFVNENPVCYLATVEGDKPKVRAFKVWLADESGVYFDTADYKEVYKQLKENPKAEVCFSLPKKMLRIAGEVEFIDDQEIRKKYFGEKEDNPKTVFFRISSGEAIYWWRDETGKSHKERVEF